LIGIFDALSLSCLSSTQVQSSEVRSRVAEFELVAVVEVGLHGLDIYKVVYRYLFAAAQ
jgi:hypothetical protein